MTDNSAIGYSEGSEPIKLTEGIEKEADKFAFNETAPNEVERYHELYTGYIAGANEWYRRGHDKAMEEMKARDENAKDQLKEERNKAIDECIERLSSYRDIDRTQMKEELQSLKSDSK